MAWDRTKPATSSLLVSADMRANWDAIGRAIAGVNLLGDPIFEIWPAGDTTAPSYWRLTGAGAAIARAGTGLADTARKLGKYCAKLTAGAGAVAQLAQNILSTTSYDDGFDGLVVSFGAWIRASAAGVVRIGINDGFASSYSSYHTGTGLFVWLEVSRTLNASATKIEVFLECAASQVGYISGPTAILGEIPPLYFHPGMIALGQETIFIAGAQTVANRKVGADRFFKRPSIIRSTQLTVQTAPIPSTVLTVRPTHWDGAVAQPIFTTNPTIPGASAIGSPVAPDGTYRYRCFEGFNTNSQTDRMMSVDVTTIGAPNPGTDLYAIFHYVYYERPLEALLAHNETN